MKKQVFRRLTNGRINVLLCSFRSVIFVLDPNQGAIPSCLISNKGQCFKSYLTPLIPWHKAPRWNLKQRGHCCCVTWAPLRLKLPTSGLVVQQLVLANHRKTLKLHITEPLWGESPGLRWIPFTYASNTEIRCHMMPYDIPIHQAMWKSFMPRYDKWDYFTPLSDRTSLTWNDCAVIF